MFSKIVTLLNNLTEKKVAKFLIEYVFCFFMAYGFKGCNLAEFGIFFKFCPEFVISLCRMPNIG